MSGVGFPDLISGECPYCGEHPMIIEHDTDANECYHCGADSEGSA